MEGIQRCSGVNCSIRWDHIIGLSGIPRNSELVRMKGFPDRKNTINVDMMQPEEWVKSCHHKIGHLAANFLMDLVVHVLEAVGWMKAVEVGRPWRIIGCICKCGI